MPTADDDILVVLAVPSVVIVAISDIWMATKMLLMMVMVMSMLTAKFKEGRWLQLQDLLAVSRDIGILQL